MFERFTDHARQVIVFAQEESRQLKHNYIGTEHILLGLTHEQAGLAAQVLQSLGVTLDGVREQVVQAVGPGEEVTAGQIPFTPRAKKVLELALRESLSLGDDYIDTEHILLGLIRESESVSGRILLDFNADPERIRTEVIRTLSGPRRGKRGTAVVAHAADLTFVIGPDPELRRLLMAAAGRALADERQEFALADLLAAASEAQDAPPTDTESHDPEQRDT
jgi:ATP-dependent Clp protease ATP-binding subunit ClpC